MSIHSASPIIRRKSRKIWVGNVPVGGDAPIAVQSMTNTETCDVAATVAQIRRLEDAGADIVRVSVPDMDAAEAFGKIKQQVNVPLVADIHFDYRIALRVAELGVDCLRINPGNIGREDRVMAVVDAARKQQPAHFRGSPPSRALLDEVRERCWAELTSHLLSNVTGQAAPVFDAQQEIVCAMTTVTDLGQLQSAEDRDALFHEALQVNQSTGGLVLHPGMRPPPR